MNKILKEYKGKWAEELPSVLWSNRTVDKNATVQTPYSLVFVAEVLIATNIVIPKTRTRLQTSEGNNQDMIQDLDTIDEIWDTAKLRIVAYQQILSKAYSENIWVQRFQLGDLVLTKALQNTTS